MWCRATDILPWRKTNCSLAQKKNKTTQHEKAALASSSYSLKEGTMCSMTQGRIEGERGREGKRGEGERWDRWKEKGGKVRKGRQERREAEWMSAKQMESLKVHGKHATLLLQRIPVCKRPRQSGGQSRGELNFYTKSTVKLCPASTTSFKPKIKLAGESTSPLEHHRFNLKSGFWRVCHLKREKTTNFHIIQIMLAPVCNCLANF